MAELLAWWETIKKDKYGKHCHDQGDFFYPFVLSVNDMLGRESPVILVQLSRTMAEKMDKPIFNVQGWTNG